MRPSLAATVQEEHGVPAEHSARDLSWFVVDYGTVATVGCYCLETVAPSMHLLRPLLGQLLRYPVKLSKRASYTKFCDFFDPLSPPSLVRKFTQYIREQTGETNAE